MADDLPPLPSIPLGRYRHYKGGEYEVVGVVRHSESLEPLVLYRPLYNDSGCGCGRSECLSRRWSMRGVCSRGLGAWEQTEFSDRRFSDPGGIHMRFVVARLWCAPVMALWLASLGGCANPNVSRDFKVRPDAVDGVATGSVSYSGRYSGYKVHFRGVTSEKSGTFETGAGIALLSEAGDFEGAEVTGIAR